MLNKKGLGLPEHWFLPIIFALFLIAGLMVMSFLSSEYQSFGQDLKNDLMLKDQEVKGVDAQYLEVELLNILKSNVYSDYSLAEILTLLPEQNNILDAVFDKSIITDVYSCNTNTEAKLVGQLSDVVGSSWMISSYNSNDDLIFVCAPFLIEFFDPGFATIVLPSADISGDITVILEVWE
jgi:hypothetical protein